jgi:probable O-glycosylation ligase (exosortase A-associated)
MRDFALVLIVFGSLPLILVQPQVGILMWFWISLMNPHRLSWGYAYELRVALVVAVATILAWLFSRERKLPPGTVTNYLLAAFAFWVTVSTFFALVPDSAWARWQDVIKILGMTFLATCIVNSRKRIEQLVWMAALSIGFYGVKGGVFTLLTGGQYRLWGPPDSFIGDNNALALALIMILPLLHFLALGARSLWIRYGLWAAMALTALATLSTYSRGGFLALGITVVAFWLKTRHRLLTGAAAVGLMGASLAFLPETWHQRMDTIVDYRQDTSANERLTVWVYALRLAADHPLVGGGFNVVDDPQIYFRYSPEADAVHNFHSIYFQVLGENGYVGLTLFVALIIASILSAQRIIRKARGRPDLEWAARLASAIQVSIVGYCAAGAFVNLGFYDLFYALVAIITCTQVVVERALVKRRADTAGTRSFALSPNLATQPSVVTPILRSVD